MSDGILEYKGLDEGLFLQTRMKSHDIEYLSANMKDMIHDSVKVLNDKLNSGRSGGLHVSAVGYCARKIVLDTAGFKHDDEEGFSVELLKIFQHGHEIHEMLGKWFEILSEQRRINLIGLEVPIPDNEWGVRGTCDGIIEWNGKRYIIEFKSISEKGFNYMLKNKGHCKSEHFFQSTIYAGLQKCDGIFVIYFSKNTEQIEVYVYKYDEDSFQNAIGKYKYLAECLNNKILPKKLGESSFQCKWCNKRKCCYSMSDDEMINYCEKIDSWGD